MNEITNYTSGISLYFGDGMQLLLIMLAVLACAILIVLALLIFRKARLWYWKVDLQVNSLEAINEKLMILDAGLRMKEFSANQCDESEQTGEAEQLAFESVFMSNTSGVESQESLQEEPAFCKSKAGVIYTEKELEELIKN